MLVPLISAPLFQSLFSLLLYFSSSYLCSSISVPLISAILSQSFLSLFLYLIQSYLCSSISVPLFSAILSQSLLSLFLYLIQSYLCYSVSAHLLSDPLSLHLWLCSLYLPVYLYLWPCISASVSLPQYFCPFNSIPDPLSPPSICAPVSLLQCRWMIFVVFYIFKYQRVWSSPEPIPWILPSCLSTYINIFSQQILPGNFFVLFAWFRIQISHSLGILSLRRIVLISI